jgi:hypothetical protein
MMEMVMRKKEKMNIVKSTKKKMRRLSRLVNFLKFLMKTKKMELP